MADNLNVYTNLYKYNTAEEFREDSPSKIEEITVMKTEIKEEVYDFEMSVRDIEYVNVKEEYYSSEENLEVIRSSEQLLNENLVSGNSQLSKEDLQKMKQGGESKKYNCTDCKYTTHHKQRLQRHIRTHTNDRPFKCTYKNCTCTAGQEEFCKCDMCGYAATQNDALKRHILGKHSEEPKKYKCVDCNYTTHRKESLQRHTSTHTDDRPFKCTYRNCECIVGQEEPCRCGMCDYAAKAKYALKKHILIKHSGQPKNYKCTNCKYSTHLKERLKRHSRTHTNDRLFKLT